jgi:hypothetical protein
MAYTLSISLALGAANANKLSSLNARLISSTGADLGAPATSNFYERGSFGSYLWVGSVPDDLRGGIEFRDGTAALAIAAINPEEALMNVLSELPAAVPPATPTVQQALMLLYMALRNRMDTSSTQLKFYNDAGQVIATASLTDTGVLYTRGELA